MNKNLSTTIFEGKHIRSFMITEDTSVIMEGSAEGLVSYESAIPEQLTYLAPEVEEFRRRKEQFRRRMQNLPAERRDEFKNNEPKFDVPKPFQSFNIEIQFDHPYWGEFRADMGAPSFNTNDPDVRDYLSSYKEKVNTLKELARLLMQVAFPGTGERFVDPVSGNRFTGAAVDTATELRRYKELLDSGIITEAEFAIKKRQLLGM